MFKGMIGDLTGGSDVTGCIPRSQFANEQYQRYVLPDETPYIHLRAAKEQFIFTDMAFIEVMGESGASTKRLVTRYEYYECMIDNVKFETAGFGLTDRDVELKFTINGKPISVDIRQDQLELAIQYYKCIACLARAQRRNAEQFNYATGRANVNGKEVKLEIKDSNNVSSVLNAISADAIQFTEAMYMRFKPESYKYVFDALLGPA
jgi:cellobiose phosphorylase